MDSYITTYVGDWTDTDIGTDTDTDAGVAFNSSI